jgi:alcohol dehydrogenase class IV
MALSAVSMIFENLPLAYANGGDVAAREKMALASTYAGFAFTRANVGNVHAIAHQLGGKYHTPHGLANAIVLPHMLRFSQAQITDKLAVLAVHARLGNEGEPAPELAERFVEAVDRLEASLGIPRQLDALRAEDIPALAKAACWEADTNYPVPRRMTQDDCETILRQLLPAEPRSDPGAKRRPPAKKRSAARKAPPRRRAPAAH